MIVGGKPRLYDHEREPFRNHPDPKIRLLAYHLSWIDAGVLHPRSKAHPRLVQPRSPPANTGLSTWLARLPIELFHMVLRHLTLQDVLSLRQTQQAFNAQVLAYPPYRTLYNTVPELLGALFTIKLAQIYTSKQVAEATSIDRCVICHRFATFLFLPTLERGCAECLRSEINFRLIPAGAAQTLFSLPSHLVKTLPKMLTYPGTYGFNERKKWRRRRWLLSAKHVINAAVSYHGSNADSVLEQARRVCKVHREQRPSKRQAAEWAMALNFESGNDPYSGVAVIYMPFLRQLTRLEQPMWCAGCERTFAEARLSSSDYQGRIMAPILERRAYTEAGLLAHSDDCPGARRLWNAICTKEA